MSARSLPLFAALAVLAPAAAGAVRPASAASVPTGFVEELVAPGLAAPTSFAFLLDGRVLVTEQNTGAIRLVVGTTVVPSALVVVPELSIAGSERGLLSIAVDPDWPARPHVYVHFSRIGGTLRLMRFTAVGELENASSTSLSLVEPYVVLDGLADAAFNHNGGALRFGPDRRLYLSLGDDANPCAAQDSTSLRGVVLRLDVAGLPSGAGGPPPRSALVPADNPFVGAGNVNAQLTWAYGLRNPFRFQIDAATGKLHVADVGQNTWEELSELEAGDNAGWPYREGPAVFSVFGCSEPGGAGSGVFVAPIDSYGHDEGPVIVAAGVLRRRAGSKWPVAWEGNSFYADYYAGWMRMLRLGPSGWERDTAIGQPDASYWATGLDRPVDYQWGPDGQLWWLSQYDGSGSGATGALRRIRATGAVAVPPGSAPPRLVLGGAPNPSRGAVSLAFELPRPAEVLLTVLDVTGRRICVVREGWRAAGRHVATWDGRDAAGTPVPAGIYLARLEAAGGRVTTRMVRTE